VRTGASIFWDNETKLFFGADWESAVKQTINNYEKGKSITVLFFNRRIGMQHHMAPGTNSSLA
jgi:hypothetical protein